jgi:hypothetical protein
LSAEETARPLALVSPTDAASGGAVCSDGNTRHRPDALESVSRPGGVAIDPHRVAVGARDASAFHGKRFVTTSADPPGSEVHNA